MKSFKMTAIASAVVAVTSLGFAQGSIAASSKIGDVVSIGCTLPGPTGATVYSVDNKSSDGFNNIDINGIQTGMSCTQALNIFGPQVAIGPVGTDSNFSSQAIPNCAPDNSAVNQGVWQQAAAYPSQEIVVGGVPTLLTTPEGSYALQQFTFACVNVTSGGLQTP